MFGVTYFNENLFRYESKMFDCMGPAVAFAREASKSIKHRSILCRYDGDTSITVSCYVDGKKEW